MAFRGPSPRHPNFYQPRNSSPGGHFNGHGPRGNSPFQNQRFSNHRMPMGIPGSQQGSRPPRGIHSSPNPSHINNHNNSLQSPPGPVWQNQAQSPGLMPNNFPRPPFNYNNRGPPPRFSNGFNGNGHQMQQESHWPYKQSPQHGQNKQGGFKRKFDGPPNKGKAKNQKIDKRDLPENNKFVCETCDRGFSDQEKYSVHVDGHEKCRVEGCSFEAAPKLVKLHFEWQHRTGVAKKIWQLESKEDINKWIEERKRNFPTSERKAQKKAEMKEKIDRGDVLETKEFGKMGKNRRNRGRRNWQDKRNRNQNESCDSDKNNNAEVQKTATDQSKEKTSSHEAAGDPLSILLQKEGSDSDDDSPNSSKVKSNGQEDTKVETTANVAGVLIGLAENYGNSSDENTEEPDTKDSKGKALVKDTDISPKTDEKQSIKGNHGNRRQRQKKGDRGKDDPGWKKKNPQQSSTRKSLLEKLLAKEIRHERNVLLQCIRYTVKTNFLAVQDKQ